MQARDRLEAHRVSSFTTARAMGWFSIALGATELLFARRLARMFAMPAGAGLIRAFGLRQVTNGVGLLGTENPQSWMWARVTGDALDIAMLATRVRGTLGTRAPVAMALTAVAGATVVDVMTARALDRNEPSDTRQPRERPDFGPRQAPRDEFEQAGTVASDFKTPAAPAASEPMQSWLP